MLTPPTTTVADAFTVATPVAVLFTVIVHGVTAPGNVQVPPVMLPAPELDAPVIDAPGAATNPFPSPASFCVVTVNVCASPTLFVPDCSIWIRASTNVFTAGPDPPTPALPAVFRNTTTP